MTSKTAIEVLRSNEIGIQEMRPIFMLRKILKKEKGIISTSIRHHLYDVNLTFDQKREKYRNKLCLLFSRSVSHTLSVE